MHLCIVVNPYSNHVFPHLIRVLNINMSAIEVVKKVEKRITMKFLTNKNVEPVEIDSHLPAQYDNDCLNSSIIICIRIVENC